MEKKTKKQIEKANKLRVVILHDLECLELKKTKDNLYHYDLLKGNLEDLFKLLQGVKK